MASVFNSVADTSRFGQLVLDAYQGTNFEFMPKHMVDEAKVLANTLAESMYQNRYKLELRKESPEKEAETEYLHDLHRTYCDKIPEYRDAIKEYEAGIRKLPDMVKVLDGKPIGPLKMEIEGY